MDDKQKKILFICDEMLLIDLYKRRLEAKGYHITVSKTDQNDLLLVFKEEIQKGPYLVVITQNVLDNTGLNTISLIRENMFYLRTPIILLNNEANNNLKDKAFSLGCNDMVKISDQFAMLVIKFDYYFTLYPQLARKIPSVMEIHELSAILSARIPDKVSFPENAKMGLITALDSIIQGKTSKLPNTIKNTLASVLLDLPETVKHIASRLL